MRKNGVVVGLLAMGLVWCAAGTASAKDDKGEESKGLVDEGCVVLADGHNQAQKQGLEGKEEPSVWLAKELRTVGEKHLCAFYDVDKYTIGVKTDGDVKPPPVVGRVKGHSTGDGTLNENNCNLIGELIDQLSTQADIEQKDGNYSGAADLLNSAQQVEDLGSTGGCFFIY
jgi:hypothetical protein